MIHHQKYPTTKTIMTLRQFARYVTVRYGKNGPLGFDDLHMKAMVIW